MILGRRSLSIVATNSHSAFLNGGLYVLADGEISRLQFAADLEVGA
jgi:hypothetical protein